MMGARSEIKFIMLILSDFVFVSTGERWTLQFSRTLCQIFASLTPSRDVLAELM